MSLYSGNKVAVNLIRLVEFPLAADDTHWKFGPQQCCLFLFPSSLLLKTALLHKHLHERKIPQIDRKTKLRLGTDESICRMLM